jgi:hypothetical protein
VLWLGLVEMKPLDHAALAAAGAFTNVLTWASDAEEFRRKAERLAANLDMYVFDVEDVSSLSDRLLVSRPDEELEDMVVRAESDPNSVVYGTFHCYPFDEG